MWKFGNGADSHLTIEEAMELTHLTRGQILTLLHQRKLYDEPVKAGSSRRISRLQLLEYIEAHPQAAVA